YASNDGSTKVCVTVRVSICEKPPSRNNASSRDASPSEKVRVTASAKPGTYPCQYDVDLVIIGALGDRIHRHCRPPARTKHPTKLREAPCRLGEEHQPEIADHRVESFV